MLLQVAESFAKEEVVFVFRDHGTRRDVLCMSTYGSFDMVLFLQNHLAGVCVYYPFLAGTLCSANRTLQVSKAPTRFQSGPNYGWYLVDKQNKPYANSSVTATRIVMRFALIQHLA